MERVSPELALIDPELAARARSTLAEPPDCLSPRPVVAATPPPLDSGQRHRRWVSLPIVLAWLFIGLFVLSPAVDLIPRSSAEPSFVDPDTSAATRPPAVAPDTAVERTELRWPEVPSADLYNLVIAKKGERVIDLWPRVNRLTVPRDGALEGRELATGQYRWFVFPGFERNGRTEFGQELASGELVISG